MMHDPETVAVIGKLSADVALADHLRKMLRDVLLELAPFVAVLSRAPNVSPDARKALLIIEPKMLEALLAQPETPR